MLPKLSTFDAMRYGPAAAARQKIWPSNEASARDAGMKDATSAENTSTPEACRHRRPSTALLGERGLHRSIPFLISARLTIKPSKLESSTLKAIRSHALPWPEPPGFEDSNFLSHPGASSSQILAVSVCGATVERVPPTPGGRRHCHPLAPPTLHARPSGTRSRADPHFHERQWAKGREDGWTSENNTATPPTTHACSDTSLFEGPTRPRNRVPSQPPELETRYGSMGRSWPSSSLNVAARFHIDHSPEDPGHVGC